MLEDKNFIELSNISILLISLMFSLIIGSGLYGYGNDYYAIYHQRNVDWGGTFDRLGWIVTTLTISNKHIGIYITTFILSISVGFLAKEYLRLNNIYSIVFFIFLFIIVIHTWPIIMATSNAMRQGLCMSFIFLAFYSSNRSYFWMIIFVFLATFVHKSGPFWALIFSIAFSTHYLLKSLPYPLKGIVHILIGSSILLISYIFINHNFADEQGSKIISGDFRIPFVLIAIIYITSSLFYKRLISNITNLNLFYFSFISLAILMNGLNWEYERLGMMMLIPYIFSFGSLLERSSNKFYLIITFLALFFLTIYMGMYDSLTQSPPLKMQIQQFQEVGAVWDGIRWIRN